MYADPWHLGFNDPYQVSWAMVVIYLLGVATAVAVVREPPFLATPPYP